MKFSFYKNKKGFSLIEMLVYVSVLTIIFLLVINTVLSFTSSYHRLAALRQLDRSGTDSLERLTRDIRNATSIDAANSVFGSASSTLQIIATQNSVSTTTKFYIPAGTLKLNVNSIVIGPLTNSDVTVTNFNLTSLTSSNSSAVRIQMTLQATNGSVTVSKKYYSTVILKGS